MRKLIECNMFYIYVHQPQTRLSKKNNKKRLGLQVDYLGQANQNYKRSPKSYDQWLVTNEILNINIC